MIAEDLLFWVDSLGEVEGNDFGLLCRRHADAMVVPRGWTLDDRREAQPRLFRPKSTGTRSAVTTRRRRPRPAAADAAERPEQLELDGTGEIPRPAIADTDLDGATALVEPWSPAFDHDDDLGGLLEVNSPLLARAFRGRDMPQR